MRDTPEIHHEIHVSQMHPEIDVSDMKETCGIHAGYMQHTCILEGNQDTYGIHMGYNSEYMHDTYLWGYGECILCVMYLRVKIQCILNVS